jgi:hypothetical protein
MEGMLGYSVIVLMSRKRFMAFFVALRAGSGDSRNCPWADSNRLTFQQPFNNLSIVFHGFSASQRRLRL